MGHRIRGRAAAPAPLIGVTTRMRLKKLLRKNIEPRCTYCAHGAPMADGERILPALQQLPAAPAQSS